MSRSLNLDKIKDRKIISISSEKALREVVPVDWSKEVLDGNKKIIIERRCTEKESLEQSLKEMELMRQGKMPERDLDNFLEQLEKGIHDEKHSEKAE